MRRSGIPRLRAEKPSAVGAKTPKSKGGHRTITHRDSIRPAAGKKKHGLAVRAPTACFFIDLPHESPDTAAYVQLLKKQRRSLNAREAETNRD